LELPSQPPAPFVDHSRALIPADAIAPIALIGLLRLLGFQAEHGFPELRNLAMGYEGYSRFWQGERQVGLAQQKRAIEELEALGTRNRSSWRMAWLAESQLQLGDLGAAESSLERAFELVKENGEGWAEPEVHRVMAEMILRKPGADMPAAQRRL
jgi:hypothetical protein